MDQTINRPTDSPFGGPDILGGGIDDPETAQPSIGRDEPEAGDRGGSFDLGGEFPAEGRADVPDGPGADQEDPA